MVNHLIRLIDKTPNDLPFDFDCHINKGCVKCFVFMFDANRFLKKTHCEDLLNINWRESMKASILCVQIVVLISICPFHILLN